ncbi:MAG: glutathione S-transferase [Rhodospirillaceae bacterium]|nr:MAG: glutathione S-transferase [Rhodospirillaceae bacterium]
MSKPLLIIGNKNYSSWSLRPWLALRVSGIAFDEKLIALFEGDWAERKSELPSGTVPVLEHDGLVIWETLAILEYIAETWPEANLWPADKAARARARSIASEMHAGFTNVRTHMSMNIRLDAPGRGMHEGVADDIARIETIWTECRKEFGAGGDFLFGEFSNADAMFSAIVSRFKTYGVKMNDTCMAYMDAIQNLAAMREWTSEALLETWTIDQDEIDFTEAQS